MFDEKSAVSIIEFAKLLKNSTLREKCREEIESHSYKWKWNFWQILEKYYFWYEPNSDPNPDFPEVWLELKATPLKTLKNWDIRAKERLVLNIIDYCKVYTESFEESSFWKKNSHLLIVFYLYEKDKNILDYLIKLVDDWKYPEEDLKIIKRDWEIINQKIKDWKAHELSEWDTFYLWACTKWSKWWNPRKQPNNTIDAKQRAYSLKQGYLNHIIANISGDDKETYWKVLNHQDFQKEESLEDIFVSHFKRFYWKKLSEIEDSFNYKFNRKAKNYYSILSKKILWISVDSKIEEFEKADIEIKTVRLKENNLPKENISFPNFDWVELISQEWDESSFKNILEKKFFFVFFQYQGDELILRKVKFWNMSSSDIEEARDVWNKAIEVVSSWTIVKEVTDKWKRYTNLPKKSENRISHVRPHARNKNDTLDLPVPDLLTWDKAYMRHCFWLNAGYVRDEIYLK